MSTKGAEKMVKEYNVVQPWEARERERDLYPSPISTIT